MEGKKFGAPEPIHGFESTTRAPPHSPFSVPAVYAMFRILCFVSRAGSVIGTDGIVIKQLKESTNSSIFVETDPSDSTYSVIRIIAVVGSPSWVKLGEQEEEVVEVSRAQNALIRAFEVVNVFKTAGNVSCRLLIEASYVDAVIGDDGGKLIERIRKGTGSSVDIFQDDLPRCAKPGDVLVKIEGNVLAVKKALVSISSRLQARQSIDIAFQRSFQRQNEVVPQDAFDQRTMDVVPREASYMSRQYREVYPRDSLHRHAEISQEDALARYFDSLSLAAYQRPIGTITQENLSQPRIDSLSRHTSVHSLSASASEYHPVTIKQHSFPALKDYKRQVVLKILCSNERASCVIGQEGSIRALQSETGISISVGDTLADCDERLITITGLDNFQDSYSPTQRAFVLVFSRLYETAAENDSITARLVVPSNEIGLLVGREAHKIPEMNKRSGAFIQVLYVKQNPKCVADSNQVVQISGKFPNVKEAINHVTIKLVENMSYRSFDVTSRPVDADPCIRPHYPFPNRFTPSAGYAPNFGQYPFMNRFTPTAGYAPNFGLPPSMDLNDIYRHSSQTPFWSQTPAAPRGVHDGIGIYDGSGGLPSTVADLRLDSRLISSNDTNTTVEFRIPENAVDFVFGHNDLQNLRELSGARIRVLESNRIIAISGTPHQIQSARNILHTLSLV
ncbi:KH domain-containing protein HEN4 [Cardamine amara subsp. amara]|uniref:KH domain-containing protein HEN4 n=1 Tax=Cardamine amara subsp. amara TaxID=228776 RepID=A0ABD0ZNR7_CARAN